MKIDYKENAADISLCRVKGHRKTCYQILFSNELLFYRYSKVYAILGWKTGIQFQPVLPIQLCTNWNLKWIGIFNGRMCDKEFKVIRKYNMCRRHREKNKTDILSGYIIIKHKMTRTFFLRFETSRLH